MQATVEVISELEGIDLELTPPCTIYRLRFTGGYGSCDQASIVRMRGECTCGHARLAFLCRECLDCVTNYPNLTGCSKCGTAGTINTRKS